jgi:hypothetical protein
LKPNSSDTATRKERKKMLQKTRALEDGSMHHPPDCDKTGAVALR